MDVGSTVIEGAGVGNADTREPPPHAQHILEALKKLLSYWWLIEQKAGNLEYTSQV